MVTLNKAAERCRQTANHCMHRWLPFVDDSAIAIEAIRTRCHSLRNCDDATLSNLFHSCVQAQRPGTLRFRPSDCIEPFALTNESLRRVLGIEYYDVQLQAGLALAAGKLAEVRTGEGKTIVAALPAVCFAMQGEGVHVATVNSYLVQRDYHQLRDVFRLLGVTVGAIRSEDSEASKRAAYGCDISYATGYDFGFDLLRDVTSRNDLYKPLGASFQNRLQGIALPERQPIQRPLAYCICDEIDSVLIDEGNMPLILAGGPTSSATAPERYDHAKQMAEALECGVHFTLDIPHRSVTLTEAGQQVVRRQFLQIPTRKQSRPWRQMVENALRAKHLFRPERDFVVQDGKVVLVDLNTGRLHTERTWQSGLHQAIECEWGLDNTPEHEIEGRITRQRLGSMYKVMCGMTGTTTGVREEFRALFGLSTVPIPTRLPIKRLQYPTQWFASLEAKHKTIAKDAKAFQALGRPVLIGTETVQQSQWISAKLTEARVDHCVLNGLQDANEADVVSQAGSSSRVTVATNMAGRGTDIHLSDSALAAGGLHVIAAQFHSSRRIDEQLAGRAGRQGQAGSICFYASAEDELIAHHAPSLAQRMIHIANTDQRIDTDLSSEIARLQNRLERLSSKHRLRLSTEDNWLDTVRTSIAGHHHE